MMLTYSISHVYLYIRLNPVCIELNIMPLLVLCNIRVLGNRPVNYKVRFWRKFVRHNTDQCLNCFVV